jgi:hypothetical protein
MINFILPLPDLQRVFRRPSTYACALYEALSAYYLLKSTLNYNRIEVPFLVEHGRDKAGKSLRAHVSFLTQLVQFVSELQSLLPETFKSYIEDTYCTISISHMKC